VCSVSFPGAIVKMVIVLSIILWLFIVGFFLRRKHYFFSLLCLWIGLYEYVGMLYLSYLDDAISGVNVHSLIAPYVTDLTIRNYSIAINVLFFTMTLFYLLIISKNDSPNITDSTIITPHRFNFLLFFLLVLGIIAIYADAGDISRLDYIAESIKDVMEHRSLPYGGLLLVCAVGLLCYSFISKKWIYAIIILLVITPISYEIFIAGRRQVFTPSIILTLMLILYNRKLKYKKFIIALLGIFVLIITALQYSFRGGIYDLDPMFIDINSISFGWHYLIAFLNSVPYFKLGDFIVDNFGLSQWAYDSDVITPMGGLSMIADSLLAFHIFGLFILGIFLSFVAHFFHEKFKRYSQNNGISSRSGLFFLSLGAMFIAHYRNGFSHAIKGLVSFSILYIFAISLPLIIKEYSAHSRPLRKKLDLRERS
jgi:hypothetical protein